MFDVFQELAGRVFGRLTVTEQSPKRGANREIYWLCRCECGRNVQVRADSLQSGKTRSCGCLHRDELSERSKRQIVHGHKRRDYKSPEYCAWQHMKERCANPNDKRYADYGGRGITVCQRWQKFENFLEDMGERPAGLTLDRVNVDGNYEPGNCRWATPREQSRNRNYVHKLTIQGVTRLQTDWAKLLGVTEGALSYHRRVRGEAGLIAWIEKHL